MTLISKPARLPGRDAGAPDGGQEFGRSGTTPLGSGPALQKASFLRVDDSTA